ncbi:expressed unknown protein [Seminavis robusta]|uniref:LRRK2 ARM repeat domain-containing protein n=1 Tax=Seminavis robusta TaxID=568900 RepID=A0A9N8H1H0_9STRA|nr:expressed unknown protein [Seminavis robusta]|eukprot:Sro40_g024920.1 n/a (1051) ;mRNA; f:133808-136960
MSNLPPPNSNDMLGDLDFAAPFSGRPPLEKSIKVVHCETCGEVTHHIERTRYGKKKVPLTKEGVVRGVCMRCHGGEYASIMAPPAQGVPQELVVKSGDDQTVVSQITLDHRFDAPDESDEESGNFRVTPGQRRPEPSLGDPDEYERPAPLRQRRQESKSRIRRPSETSTDDFFREREREIRNNFAPLPPPGTNLQNNPWMEAQMQALGGGPAPQPQQAQQQQQQQAQPPQQQQPPQPPSQQQQQQQPFYMNNNAQVPQIFEHQVMHHQPYTSSTYFGAAAPGMGHVYTTERPPSIASSYGQEEKAEIEPAHDWSALTNALPTNTTTTSHNKNMNAPNVGHLRSLSDIPELVNHLNSSNNLGATALPILQRMADIVWKYGHQAKLAVIQHNALEGLLSSMWENIADASVQEAALDLIFALVSSSDGLPSSDVFTGAAAENVIDALLIVMQTHLTVENIQHTGCGTLGCLAAASGNNSAVDDASLSGALDTVVGALECHRNSGVVQCTGIRALYNQCIYSRHAESNKRSLAKHGMEEKKCGASVIYRAIEVSEGDMVTMEWACRLYWCLSASEDVAEFLTVTNHPIYLILEALQRYNQSKVAGGLLEASLGALANLVRVRENHKVVDSSVLFLVVKTAQTHQTNEDLLVEACALIANLIALCSENATAAVDADAIEVIFNALQAFPESVPLFEEAVRALLSLCLASEDGKRYLCTPAMLLCLSGASNSNIDSASGQEMFVNLMGSFMAKKGFHQTVIHHGGVEACLAAMKAHPNDRRVQEAACLAFRNLACHVDETTNFDFMEPIQLMSLAMARHASSESIQLNCCRTLWNVASMKNSGGMLQQLNNGELIDPIVKAMQTHMESAAVLEVACGALCGKIMGSLEGKKCLVESGGLDAVTCVLVMHPTEPAALEKAFGVLSSMSASQEFADDVANAQCMTNVVEAMRANSSSITLLEFGCLVLRNIILLRPEHVSESSSVVATILNGMRNNPDAVGFQREACSLLWAMAAVSESCKSKVLSLDGIAVLLGCLEHNSSFADVQDAALGAFNQLG